MYLEDEQPSTLFYLLCIRHLYPPTYLSVFIFWLLSWVPPFRFILHSFDHWTVTLQGNTLLHSHTLSLLNLPADPCVFVEKWGMFSFTCLSFSILHRLHIFLYFFPPLHLGSALERWKRRGGVDVELEKDRKCDPSLDVSSSVKRASAGCP